MIFRFLQTYFWIDRLGEMLLFIFFVPFPNVGIDLIKFKNIVDVFWLSDGQLTIAQDKLGDEFSEEVTEQDVWKMTGILRVGC